MKNSLKLPLGMICAQKKLTPIHFILKQIILMTLVLTICASAQGASFGCAKATSKVEHIVCDTPEISKLDEELAQSYKEALKNQARAGQIKRAQKQWLKERNDCADVRCVKRIYETRLSAIAVADTSLDSMNESMSNDSPQNAHDDAKNEWHCEQELIPAGHKICEEERDAEPYRYEIRSVLPGKGYSLCELMLENMRAQSEPMSCELKIAPEYRKYFSLPNWEDIDPWADVDLLWQVDVMGYRSGPAYEARKKLTKEEWLAQLRKESREENTRRIMRRARFDLNGDGKEDWVLAYQYEKNQPCNPWRALYRQGYKLFILDKEGKPLSRYASPTLGQVPFFFSLKDPRFPSAHTYRFAFFDHLKFNDHLPRQIEIYGSSSREGVEKIPACRFELLKLQTLSTNHDMGTEPNLFYQEPKGAWVELLLLAVGLTETNRLRSFHLYSGNPPRN